MGGPYLQTFLASYVDQQWKDQYIASLISLGGSFDGAPMTALQMAAGTSFGIPLLDKSAVKGVIRNLGGAAWMLPQPSNKVMYMTPTRNYTSAQMEEFFVDMKSPRSFDIYKSTIRYGDKKKAPGVAVHCLYGVGTPTITAPLFSSADPPIDEELKQWLVEDGDQTVPLDSLALCDAFANYQDQSKYPVIVDRYRNVTHISIVLDPKIFARVLDIVTKN